MEDELNNCLFTGTFVEKPILESSDDGVSYVRFYIEVPTYRKTKNGEKSKNYVMLTCEAWHTGAETIAKVAKAGTKITIQCLAKWDYEDKKVIFRVNEFDFNCID